MESYLFSLLILFKAINHILHWLHDMLNLIGLFSFKYWIQQDKLHNFFVVEKILSLKFMILSIKPWDNNNTIVVKLIGDKINMHSIWLINNYKDLNKILN